MELRSRGAYYTLDKGLFILHRNCVAVPIYYIYYISAAIHCSITAFQVNINLTIMRHHNAVTLHECEVRRGMNGP